MARKAKRVVGGSVGSLATGAWGLYSNFTTIKDLPSDAGWVAQMMADPPIYAPWLLFVLSLFFLGWVIWPRDEEDEEDRSSSPKTTGPQSPAIGAVHGNVTNNYGPPEPQKKSTYNLHNSDGLLRALESARNPHGLATFRKGPIKPDLPLNALLARVYKGRHPLPTEPSERAAFKRKIDLEIADKISQNDAHVWGRIGDRPLAEISQHDWNNGTFRHQEKSFSIYYAYAPDATTYEDIYFNKSEIEQIWPMK